MTPLDTMCDCGDHIIHARFMCVIGFSHQFQRFTKMGETRSSVRVCASKKIYTLIERSLRVSFIMCPSWMDHLENLSANHMCFSHLNH